MRPALLLAVMTLLALPPAGCNIVGPVLFLAHGPPKTNAIVALDPARPTVVFVDDLRNKIPRRSLRHVIAETAEQELMGRDIVKEGSMISSRSVIHEAALETYSEPLSIVDAGRRVGAEVVIYITVDDWTLSREGAGIAPQADLRLKLVDTLTDKRVFPESDIGFPFRVRMPVQSQMTISSLADKAAIEQTLAQTVGFELARLFYDHEKDPISTRTR